MKAGVNATDRNMIEKMVKAGRSADSISNFLRINLKSVKSFVDFFQNKKAEEIEAEEKAEAERLKAEIKAELEAEAKKEKMKAEIKAEMKAELEAESKAEAELEAKKAKKVNETKK